MRIRLLKAKDWPTVKEIYSQGIKTGNATFQAEIPDWEVWDKSHLTIGRLIAEVENHIVGWAALSPVSFRSVYAGIAEVSVYVHKDH